MANWSEYRKRYKDMLTRLDDARNGIDTTEWEKEWINKANNKFGKNPKILSKYKKNQLAQLLYANWGKNEGRTYPGQDVPEGQASSSSDDYFDTVANIRADQNLGDDEKAAFIKQAAEREYGTTAFDVDQFEGLLGRLEASKKRQQRQKSVEGRRDIFAQGLAGMMGNF